MILKDRINRIRLEFKVHTGRRYAVGYDQGINRIRLEFKADYSVNRLSFCRRINRIRLEFKADRRCSCMDFFRVLIESDWNLK